MINCISNWSVELRAGKVGGKNKDETGVEMKMIFKDVPGICKLKETRMCDMKIRKGWTETKNYWMRKSIMIEDIKHNKDNCHDTSCSRPDNVASKYMKQKL